MYITLQNNLLFFSNASHQGIQGDLLKHYSNQLAALTVGIDIAVVAVLRNNDISTAYKQDQSSYLLLRASNLLLPLWLSALVYYSKRSLRYVKHLSVVMLSRTNLAAQSTLLHQQLQSGQTVFASVVVFL